MSKDNRPEISLPFPLWCIPLAIMFTGLLAFVGYAQYHDAGITVEHLIADWTCEDIKEYLDYDGKKIIQNHLRSSVEKVYAEKCKT